MLPYLTVLGDDAMMMRRVESLSLEVVVVSDYVLMVELTKQIGFLFPVVVVVYHNFDHLATINNWFYTRVIFGRRLLVAYIDDSLSLAELRSKTVYALPKVPSAR